MAYASRGLFLTKCGRVRNSRGVVGRNPECPDCKVPGAWPSEAVQIATGFLNPRGGPADKLVGRS